jgi:hypothetical protein
MIRPEMQDLTYRLHIRLIQAFLKSTRDPTARRMLAEAPRPDAAPDARYIYYLGLGFVWFALLPIIGIAVGCLGWAANALLRVNAGPATATAAVFVGVFCLVGAGDALWRLGLVSLAEKRYDRARYTFDARSRALMRLSNINDFTVFLQFAIAAFFAWRFG